MSSTPSRPVESNYRRCEPLTGALMVAYSRLSSDVRSKAFPRLRPEPASCRSAHVSKAASGRQPRVLALTFASFACSDEVALSKFLLRCGFFFHERTQTIDVLLRLKLIRLSLREIGLWPCASATCLRANSRSASLFGDIGLRFCRRRPDTDGGRAHTAADPRQRRSRPGIIAFSM